MCLLVAVSTPQFNQLGKIISKREDGLSKLLHEQFITDSMQNALK